ncbi:MAG: M15 family metallopeptidase [Lachnospiraceae bacterium]|nr:M15 family metallopeptidase [Lachnospiraceae bacterium]
MIAERLTYQNASGELAPDFYIEPLSAALQRYITGVSYPAVEANTAPEITPDELRYLHILHYDFEGEVAEGELICNQAIAADLVDIFYELYRNEYQIEKVLLIDEYGGDDTASMEDNNTSCFNYRVVEGSTSLSKHALGLAIDINPYYNPYITYDKQGGMHVSPESAALYADRSVDFPYKIDENDLCYKLFVKHGFTWGGNWNSVKDYQHFQKTN